MFAFEIEISLIDKFEMIDGITANDVDFRSHSVAYDFLSLSLSLAGDAMISIFDSIASREFHSDRDLFTEQTTCFCCAIRTKRKEKSARQRPADLFCLVSIINREINLSFFFRRRRRLLFSRREE